MKYTTLEEKLLMPEYGRNVQQMVKHCIAIADRTERTRCARTIISIMGNMFPHLRDVPDFKHKLWDHLAIMSDFQLDIDYPYEVVKRENLYIPPKPMRYRKSKIAYAFYGRFLQETIEKAKEIENENERQFLVNQLAGYMKRSYLTWNREPSVENEKIFDDVQKLSKGQLRVDAEMFRLQMAQQQSNANHRQKQIQQNKKKNVKQ